MQVKCQNRKIMDSSRINSKTDVERIFLNLRNNPYAFVLIKRYILFLDYMHVSMKQIGHERLTVYQTPLPQRFDFYGIQDFRKKRSYGVFEITKPKKKRISCLEMKLMAIACTLTMTGKNRKETEFNTCILRTIWQRL